MQKTKQRILDTALRLFNEQGLAKVTLRTIAGEMKISQGNLNYHFKKREDIIRALYQELVEKMNKGFDLSQNQSLNLKAMQEMSAIIYSNLYEYRFFMLDFTQVMRSDESIKKHYQDLLKLREDQFGVMCGALVENGLMRREELPNEYLNLFRRMQLIGDFWLPYTEIRNNSITKEAEADYLEMLLQMVYPYLTEKGKKELFA